MDVPISIDIVILKATIRSMKKRPSRFATASRCRTAINLLFLSLLPNVLVGQSTDALINKLVQKGILTIGEAKALREETNRDVKMAQDKGIDDNDVKFFWKDGLAFKSRDNRTFQGKIGGRLLLDAALYPPDDKDRSDIGNTPAGAEFRQVRLRTEGRINTGIETKYKLQLDFAGGEVAFKDVYIELSDIPVVGNVRAGHFKETIGLEAMNSRRFLTFMERSTVSDAFWAERNTGLSFGNSFLNDRMTWSSGTYIDVDDGGDGDIDSNGSLASRLTGLPYENLEKRQLLHLGFSVGGANAKDNSVRYRARPDSHLAPRFIDTGTFDAHNSYLVASEVAFVWGPLSIQGEYMHQIVDTIPAGEISLSGYYVTGSYFLTGESRQYKKSTGAFDRISPFKNFSLSGSGIGAVQLALRYSSLDLNNSVVAGGKMDTITAGLNWHLTPSTRAMFNYIYADVETNAGTDVNAHIVQGRLQVDF